MFSIAILISIFPLGVNRSFNVDIFQKKEKKPNSEEHLQLLYVKVKRSQVRHDSSHL